MRAGVRRDDGSVAAEFAVVLPAVLAVVALAVGAVGAASQSVRLADAAAVAARQTARGDAGAVPVTVAALAPGARVASSVDGAVLCLSLTRPVSLGPLSGVVTLSARSCAPTAGG
ncbi:TadE family type IV pilus minor pilin [Frigoribacterium faeni]|uniref:TadE family type IV pilus minor pilin n=1 Tax=Frigoribacterium faeni TaxID=145483 RepID=UPI001ABBD1E0|nr:Flp pilus assembly protein TadG [Frigoribacterium faeni]